MARLPEYMTDGGVANTPPRVTIDPYYLKDPKTGLSPAQVEAQAAQAAAKAQAQTLAQTFYAGSKDYNTGVTYDPKTGLLSGTPTPYFAQQGLGTLGGRKVIGKGEWKHPKTGITFIYDKYDDGSSALQEWFNSIGGEAQASEFDPVQGYKQPHSLEPGAVGVYNWLPGFTVKYSKQESGGGTAGGTFGGGTTQGYTASDGRTFTDQSAYLAYQAQLDQQKAQRQSAYDLLYEQFNQYGLGALVTPLRGLIESGISPSEFTLRLRETEAYKKRFAANQGRIAKGLRALSEAEYIGLEDQYQNVMRQYGLPASYYTKGDMGVQPGFEKFLSGDVSPAELEDRIQTAQNRVINAAPQVTQALKQFYPDITNGDILAYALDPEQALTTLKRKVTAAEIGGAALQAGLETGLTRAEELQRYGVTQQAAQQGFQTIAGGLERGRQLSQIYQQPEYTQTTAEQEVFGLPSATEAARQRKRLGKLEQATFGGTSGAGGGALGRERAGQF